MDNNILDYIFQNTKNIINDAKNIFKDIVITNNEKKYIYLFLHNILNNIYNNVLKKKLFLKKNGLVLDDNFFIIFYNIIDKLNSNFKEIKKGGLYIITNTNTNTNTNKNLSNYISLIEPSSKKIFKFTNNINKIDINKKISNFFKILENIFKINKKDYNDKKKIFFTNNIIINDKNNYFIKYFKRLIKKYTDEISENFVYNDIMVLQNNQQNFFNKSFRNYLNTYIISKKINNYNIDISLLTNNLNNFLVFLDNNNLSNIKIGIYLKIISEIFLSKNFKNTEYINENKVIYFIIIILGILIIEDFFINIKKFKVTKNIIITLFTLIIFLLTLITIILK